MKKLFVSCAVLALFAAAGGAFAGDPAMQGTVHTITLPDLDPGTHAAASVRIVG